ncbi:hypothetical protein ACP70R_001891 [Stipagrostis hirtigluma subsp. patula]
MATPPGPGKDSKGRTIKFTIGPSSAGSSGGGGGDEATPPPPPPLPRPSLAPPSPRPGRATVISGKHLPSLRRPPPSAADEDEEEDDYYDSDDEEEDEEHEGYSQNDFRCLLMSDQSNTPLDIVRRGSVPLNKHEYLSLLANWRHLLAGKRTYLRPPKYHVANDVFQCPFAQPRTIGCQEPISTLVHESRNNSIIQKKIKLLGEQYSLVRRPRRDGSSFYRAFLFSYLQENIGRMQDSRAEFTRLMECVARSNDDFSCLNWDSAYFLNPEGYFSSVVSEFRHWVHLAANGLSADDLYKRNQQEIMSSRILSLLRLLTETEIRAKAEHYKPYFPEYKTALEFCLKVVRPMDIEVDSVQIRALSNALGIPLRVEVADASLQFGIVQAKNHDFFPQSESRASTASGPVHSSKSYSTGKTAELPEQQRDHDTVEQARVSQGDRLLSSDGIPLVTLLVTNGQYDILYRK